MTFGPAIETDILPRDHEQALLVGRAWDGRRPRPITVRKGRLHDLSGLARTVSEIFELQDCAALIAAHDGPVLDLGMDALMAPCDLQAVKAAGVTFADSMLERVVEERARGDAQLARTFREEIEEKAGQELAKVKPATAEADAMREAMIGAGLWSQYLEVGLGPYAEIFTKCQPLAAVGAGAEIGLHPISSWNNPEPEVVLAVNSKGQILGATLGNDVNLRDIEGRSALLLPLAKDNNASCAIGPFIRLFDKRFTLDDVRTAEVSLRIDGPDGFTCSGTNSMDQISRDPTALVAQACGETHQYPDGFMLFCGTMYVPTDDRDEPGQGFTHKMGDVVRISSPMLGRLQNKVTSSDLAPPWTFGIAAMMRALRDD